jgi:hypothetical protein
MSVNRVITKFFPRLDGYLAHVRDPLQEGFCLFLGSPSAPGTGLKNSTLCEDRAQTPSPCWGTKNTRLNPSMCLGGWAFDYPTCTLIRLNLCCNCVMFLGDVGGPLYELNLHEPLGAVSVELFGPSLHCT